MPRLEGERSNAGTYILLLIVLVFLVMVGLEYIGLINLIPGFGS